MARHFMKPENQPERTLVFVASGGHHSPGLNGPANFVRMNPALTAKTVLVLNLEHIAQFSIRSSTWTVEPDEQAMSFGISNESPALIDIGKRGVERYGFNLNPTFSAGVPGDLGGYQPLGVARVQAIHSGPMYHTTGDVADTISVPGLERAARFFSFFVTEVAKTLAGADQRSATDRRPQVTQPVVDSSGDATVCAISSCTRSLKPSPKAVHGHFDRALRHVEQLAGFRVAQLRRVAGQIRLQASNSRTLSPRAASACSSAKTRSRSVSAHRRSNTRSGVSSVGTSSCSRSSAASNSSDTTRTSPPRWPACARPRSLAAKFLSEVRRNARKRPRAGFACWMTFFEQPGEERLRQVLGVFRASAAAAQVGVQRIPVQFTECGQRLFCSGGSRLRRAARQPRARGSTAWS